MNFVERENPVNRQTIKKCAKSNDYVTWHKTCLNNNMSEIINYWILSAWSEKNCRCWAAKYLYSEHNDKIGGRTFRIGDLNLFCSYDLLPTKTPPFLFAFASPRDKKKVSTKLHSTMLGASLITIFKDFGIIQPGLENQFPTTLPICDINTIHKITPTIYSWLWLQHSVLVFCHRHSVNLSKHRAQSVMLNFFEFPNANKLKTHFSYVKCSNCI